MEEAMKRSRGHHMDFIGAEGADPLTASVFSAFKRAMRLNRQLLLRLLAEKGGHPGQAACLWILTEQESMTQRDMAEALHLAPPTVTAMLQKMERAGYVERWDDETDQRLTRIRLTETGKAFSQELRSVHADYIAMSVGAMSQKDQKELARLLDALGDSVSSALDGLGEAPDPTDETGRRHHT